MKVTETSVTTGDYVLPEWFGCQVDSESIAPSRNVGCAAQVSSQSERCRDDHNVRVRLRTRRSRAEFLLKSETVNPEHVRGEMAKLNPSEATETSLDGTNRDDERLPQRRTARKQWQRNAFTYFTGVPRNPRKLARELMTGTGGSASQSSPFKGTAKRQAAQSAWEPFIATHGNVPRKIRAADQSKRD